MYKYILFISVILFSCKDAELKNPTPTKEQVSESFTYPKDLSLDFIMGKFNPNEDSSFIKIPIAYADQEGRLMKKEAFESFQKMHAAAKKEGINLVIRSAVRNFDYQKGIWERKWTGATKLSNGEDAQTAYSASDQRAKKILEYSSMPGTSRHHWGTDIDLNSFENSWFESGEGLKVFEWLDANAADFGFCRPYTRKDESRPFGYNEEKWHWSYTPLSDIYTQFAEEHLNAHMISGFKGSEVSDTLDVVNKYVLGINHNCISH